MKKIVFSISHTAHLNLFKNLIEHFNKQKKYDVFVVGLNRGKLPQIIENELSFIKKISILGSWKPNKYYIVIFTNIFRIFTMFFYYLKKKPDVIVSSGGVNLSIPARLLKIPVLEFCDDPDRKFNLKLETFFCTRKYYPPIIKPTKKISVYNALKQWAYLAPSVFSPNIKILSDYNLQPENYLFIREVSNKSLNYSQQEDAVISKISKYLSNYKVLISLEDKSLRNKYPNDWILLDEPVKDIHSLIYFSKLLISSGDSMAREGSLLGVPSIYVGSREMGANSILVHKNLLFKINVEDSLPLIEKILSNEIKYPQQQDIRNSLSSEWIDLNKYMLNEIMKYIK